MQATVGTGITPVRLLWEVRGLMTRSITAGMEFHQSPNMQFGKAPTAERRRGLIKALFT
jgi:hypothetical protein